MKSKFPQLYEIICFYFFTFFRFFFVGVNFPQNIFVHIDEIIEKFMEFSVPVLGEQRTTLIRDLVMGLDQPNMRFADLTQHLYAEP